MNFKKNLSLLAFVTMLFASIAFVRQASQAQSAPATSFYDLDVIAVAGQNSLSAFLFPAPSINDKGIVSFVGKTVGNHIIVSESPGTHRRLNPGGITNSFGGNTQITNANQVVALELVPVINQMLLQCWDGNNQDSRTVVAGASNAFNDFFAIRPNPSINNNHLPAFAAQANGSLQPRLVTGTRDTAFNQLFLPHPLKPMIADNGLVVVRAGNTGTSSIVLYQFNLTSPVTIASSPDFTLLGDSPGISDDGSAVVFFGDPAIMIDGSDEPGVFASIDEGTGTRKLIRLTGRTAELGRDAAGNPIGFDSTSIAFFNRVTVIYQELGGPGPDGDTFTACFQATPTAASPDGLFTAENGLWTLRTDIKLVSGTLEYIKLRPVPVVQIGSVVGGRTIVDIVVNDAISCVTTDTIGGIPRALHPGENRVTFFATTNSDDIIVRASYLDPDEDNLPSHWETRGVDFGAGLIDLPAMGANPFHKDLFVQADWMVPNAGVVFKPKAAALKIVMDAFRRAPVQNPDGTMGINLHIDAGPDSIMNPMTNAKWNALSRAGSVPHQTSIVPCTGGPPCSYDFTDLDNIKAIHFNATRRAPVFHYALFADNFGLGDSTGGMRGGVSRDVPGADFMITLSGGTVFTQAGTFMHEFGHNLGLRHGGDEDMPERKPHYLSVMNYRFSYDGLIRANGTREYDYSRRKLADLDETALNESVGIMDPDNHRTIWGAIAMPCTQQLTPPAIDWNCNGLLTPSPLQWDINGDGLTHIPLRGFQDWPALVFHGGGRIGTGAARTDVNILESDVAEPSRDEIENSVPLDIRQQTQCSIEENVTLTPETGGATPLNVTFDATASTAPCGTIVSYSWDFGDNTTGSGSTVMHTYTAPGVYIAKLSMTDNNGNTNLVQLDHVVNIPCNFSISQASQFFTSSGGQGSTNVTGLAGCNWTIASNKSWIVIVSGETGSGSGPVDFEIRENLLFGSRHGTVTVAGQTLTITQLGNCSFSITPQSKSFVSGGGTGSVNVTVSNDCDWTAISNDSWITITSGSVGIGSGSVSYSVAPNTGPTRTGTMIIAGKTFTVTQKPGS